MTNLIYPLDVVKRLESKWTTRYPSSPGHTTAHDWSTGEQRETLNAERIGRWRSCASLRLRIGKPSGDLKR